MVVDSQMDLFVLEVLDNDHAEYEWVVHIPHHTSGSANHVITRKRTTYKPYSIRLSTHTNRIKHLLDQGYRMPHRT